MNTAHARVSETLTARRAELEALAKLLMDQEVVTAESLRGLLADPATQSVTGHRDAPRGSSTP